MHVRMVAGDPSDYCHARSEDGHGQRRPGTATALTHVETADVYMQEIPEDGRATVDSIHRELKADGFSKARKSSRRQKATAALTGESEKRADSGSVVGKGIRISCAKQSICSNEFSI